MASIIEDAGSWTWSDATLSEYARILTAIDAAATADDEDAMQRAYHALVKLGGRTRFGSRAERPVAPDGRFPHERTNELVHRLRARATPTNQDATTPAQNSEPGDDERP